MSGAERAAPGLRFAILSRSTTLQAWAALCVRELLRLDGVEPALRIQPVAPPFPRRARRRAARELVWELVWRTDLRVRGSAANRPVSLERELAPLPVLRCRLRRHARGGWRLEPADLREIQRRDLDFILAFPGYLILRGGILEAARYGVWSYHHGDEQRYRGVPPGVWEILDGESFTGAILQRLTERLDAGIVLKKGRFPTRRHSIVANEEAPRFESAGWAAAVCRDLLAGRAGYLDAPASRTQAPIRRNPNNRQALRLAWILLSESIRRAPGGSDQAGSQPEYWSGQRRT